MRNKTSPLGYTPIDIRALPIGVPLRFSVYYRSSVSQRKLVRLGIPGKVLTREVQQQLIRHGVAQLLVRTQELRQLDSDEAKEAPAPSTQRDESESPLRIHARRTYTYAVETIQRVLESPPSAETIDDACSAVRDMVGAVLEDDLLLAHLSSLTAHDYYTYTHSVNVCVYSIALLYRVGERDSETLERIGVAGIFHDLGKNQIGSEILNKPGCLDEQEWSLMQKHPLWGAHQLHLQQQVHPSVVIGVLQHHEQFNGLGYPNGVFGDSIHLFGRVICVADVFDALTTNRSYKEAVLPVEALRTMAHEMRGHFDPSLLIAFAKFVSETRPDSYGSSVPPIR